MGCAVSKDRQPRRGRPSAARRERGAAGADSRLVQRIMDELHTEDRPASAGEAPNTRAPSIPRRIAERRNVILSVLELARTETAMDVAVLGEIRNGRETARLLAGDAQSFGLELGWSMAVEDSYCQRLLEGRLPNIVPDTRANEHVRDLAVTRAARIGAYIGVPLSTLNARLYILCCLAHEQRPSLSRRDVVLLRGLGETIAAELDAAAID
jgi:GAF domain-containing protein